jgi:phosphatidylethanolamine/phosphatidyl-N-methylethanolamine N-methyltransferase
MSAVQPKLATIDKSDIHVAYRRWAPFYDQSFGKFAEAAAQQAVARVNTFSGKLLDVGVGTGLALPHYHDGLSVTGIDLSPHMLRRARERLQKAGRRNVEALVEMDATALDFADATFDVAVAMFVLTVAPEPARVMHELARVTRPGGRVVICNHFSSRTGLRAMVEKGLAPYASKIGWRAEFPEETIMVSPLLELVAITRLKPFGIFSLIEFRRRA